MKLGNALAAAGATLSDWRWFPFFLQRRFRRRRHRDAVARLLSRVGPRRATSASLERGNPLAAALIEDGQAVLGSVLGPAECKGVRLFLERRRVRDDYRPGVAPWLPLGGGRHPHSHVGYHTHDDIVRAPHLLALANRPEILEIAERFLGCRPTIAYLAAWWSYPTELGAQQAENFHRDVDDWRFLKLFVYLTDVETANGPHVYVKGSANAPRAAAIRRYSDEEIQSEFGSENIVYMTGKAGDAFLENTYGFHKGQPVQRGTRLIFQAVYSIVALPYGPSRPVIGRDEAVGLATVELDPFVNRIYVAG